MRTLDNHVPWADFFVGVQVQNLIKIGKAVKGGLPVVSIPHSYVIVTSDDLIGLRIHKLWNDVEGKLVS